MQRPLLGQENLTRPCLLSSMATPMLDSQSSNRRHFNSAKSHYPRLRLSCGALQNFLCAPPKKLSNSAPNGNTSIWAIVRKVSTNPQALSSSILLLSKYELTHQAFRNVMKCKTNFYGLPTKHLGHKPWRLAFAKRESVRGVIRGAAARERLLHPSPAKAMQRRTRIRLVQAYIGRFGQDEFTQLFMASRMKPISKGNWLSRGFAYWRNRVQGALCANV
jgi:hypothetical protein